MRIHWVWSFAAVLLIGCSGNAKPNNPGDAEQPPATNNEKESGKEVNSKGNTNGGKSNSRKSIERPMDLSYVTEDFFAALVIHSRRIVESQKVGGVSLDSPFGVFDALACDRIVLLVAPFSAEDIPGGIDENVVASKTPNGSKPKIDEPKTPDFSGLFEGLEPEPESEDDLVPPNVESNLPPYLAIILQFHDDRSAAGLIQQFARRCVQLEHEGKKYYVRGHPTLPWAAFIPNKRTVLVGSDLLIEKMMSSKDAKSSLAKRLADVDMKSDVVAVAEIEPIRETAMKLVRRLKDKSAIDGLAKLAEAAGVMTINASQSSDRPIEFRLQPQGDQSPDEFLNLARGGLEILKLWGKNSFNDLQKSGGSNRSLAAVASKIVEQLSADLDEGQVVVRANRPDDFPETVSASIELAKTAIERHRRFKKLRQIVGAMYQYVDVNRQLPDNSPYGISKHPTSWRVKLLPYLDEGNLFDEYDFDQPWDSKGNMKVLERMPEIYGSDGSKTSIMAFTGEDTPTGGEPLMLRDIKDGLEKTLFVVRAGSDKSVPWTKPVDLAVDWKNPTRSLGTIPADGFDAAFFDGRATTLPKDINTETLIHLINPNDGQ